MWTKQHQAFCPACGRYTNHVTHYQKDDAGSLVADVRCAECQATSEAAA
jgi:ribosomal protein L44E